MSKFSERLSALLCLTAIWTAFSPGSAAARTPIGVRQDDVLSTCYRADAIAWFSLKPHCSGWATVAGRKYFLSFNAQGLRDKDYSSFPPRGTTRILFAGPSFVNGPGLKEEDIPPRQYEKALRKQGMRAEVINAGVDGYSPLRTFLKLPEQIDAYHPQVILVFSLFDSRDWLESFDLRKNAEGKLSLGNLYWDIFAKMPKFFQDRIEGQYIRTRFNSIVTGARRAYLAWGCRLHRKREDQAECMLGYTLGVFSQMRDLAKQRGVKFLVLVQEDDYRDGVIMVPDFDPFWIRLFDRITPYFVFSVNEVMDLLRKHEIPHMELPAKMFRPRIPGDYHLSEEGARTFGLELAQMTRDFLLEKSDSR